MYIPKINIENRTGVKCIRHDFELPRNNKKPGLKENN